MQEAKIIRQETKEEPKIEKYTIGEVITGTATSIIVNGKAITEQALLAEIANKVDRLEKNLIGN